MDSVLPDCCLFRLQVRPQHLRDALRQCQAGRGPHTILFCFKTDISAKQVNQFPQFLQMHHFRHRNPKNCLNQGTMFAAHPVFIIDVL